jgi:hypothetical protein
MKGAIPMAIQETELQTPTSLNPAGRSERRKRFIWKLGIGCLAIFLLGFLVITAMEKIQDMTDRAH